MAASHLSGDATASQTGTFGFRTVATTATGWGPDTAACPTSQDLNHCDRNFTAEFASHESIPDSRTQQGPGRWDWATVLCFSCGKTGHGATRCPVLDVSFLFLLPGWKAEKLGSRYAMISPRVVAECRRAENGD